MRIGLIALALAVPAAASARIIDRVVAVVNDEIITWSELEDLARPVLAQIEGISDPVQREQTRERQLRKLLDDMVGQRLIMQEADRRRITVDTPAVDKHIDRVKARQGWGDEQFKMYLSAQGISLVEFRKQVRDNLLRQRIIRRVLGSRVAVTDRELKDFYKEQVTQVTANYEVEAAHIVLKVPKNATAAEDAAKRQQANEIRARAEGGEDFTALAAEYSEGPRAKEGGRLGRVGRGNLDPNLEEAIFALEPPTVGGPVRTGFGYHVINVIARHSVPPPSYEDWLPEGTVKLREKKLTGELTKWVVELKKKAFIEVRL